MQADTIINLKAQVDQAGLCMADVHGYIGQGELAFGAIEVAANVQVRVEWATGWLVDWVLIETDDEIMICCSDTDIMHNTQDDEFVGVGRRAYWQIREVVAAKIGGTIAELLEALQDSQGENVAVGLYPPWHMQDNETMISALVPLPDGTLKRGVY